MMEVEKDSINGAAPLFGALLRKRRTRWRWWVMLALAVVVAGGVAVRKDAGGFRVMTSHGFRTLDRGMSATEVGSFLGGPIAQERDPDGRACFIYGHPTLKLAEFTAYAACYREGRLERVVQRAYSTQSIDPEVLRKLLPPDEPAAP